MIIVHTVYSDISNDLQREATLQQYNSVE